MDIRLENGININNSLLLCDWSNEKGERFQKQWMGTKISYPLDIDKIQKMDNVFSIFNEEEFIGIIQIIRFKNNNAHIYNKSSKNRTRIWKSSAEKVFEVFI